VPVVDAVGADVLLVVVDGAVHDVDSSAAGVTVEPLDSLDVTRPLARAVLDSAPATPVAHFADLELQRGWPRRPSCWPPC
jgi:hypothetical protein